MFKGYSLELVALTGPLLPWKQGTKPQNVMD